VGRTIYTKEHKRLTRILRELREEAGLRQSDVADALGKPQSFASKYEAGERRLDLVELDEICSILGVKLSELVRRYEKR
jgi:transcriptional regulator with XRE-family HTH domain